MNDTGRCAVRGFTLLELVIVIVVIGILASVAIPGYFVTREKAIDKDAAVGLRSIQVGQKAYHYDNYKYYPDPAASSSNTVAINENLSILLDPNANSNWVYTVKNNGCACAQRRGGTKFFSLNITNDGDPVEGVACGC